MKKRRCSSSFNDLRRPNAKFFQVDRSDARPADVAGEGLTVRIVFNTAFEEVTRAMQRAAESLADAQRQVSTGLRMGRLSDDPLSAAAAVDEHAELDRLDAYQGAGDAASYRLGLADNVLTDIVNQLTAAQTTALSARGSSATQVQRDAAANELLAIRDSSDERHQHPVPGRLSVQRFERPRRAVSRYPAVRFRPIKATRMRMHDRYRIRSGCRQHLRWRRDFSGLRSGPLLDALTAWRRRYRRAIRPPSTPVSGAEPGLRSRASAQARIGNDLRSLDDARSMISAAHAQRSHASLDDRRRRSRAGGLAAVSGRDGLSRRTRGDGDDWPYLTHGLPQMTPLATVQSPPANPHTVDRARRRRVVEFPSGIPGFESHRRFVLDRLGGVVAAWLSEVTRFVGCVVPGIDPRPLSFSYDITLSELSALESVPVRTNRCCGWRSSRLRRATPPRTSARRW